MKQHYLLCWNVPMPKLGHFYNTLSLSWKVFLKFNTEADHALSLCAHCYPFSVANLCINLKYSDNLPIWDTSTWIQSVRSFDNESFWEGSLTQTQKVRSDLCAHRNWCPQAARLPPHNIFWNYGWMENSKSIWPTYDSTNSAICKKVNQNHHDSNQFQRKELWGSDV